MSGDGSGATARPLADLTTEATATASSDALVRCSGVTHEYDRGSSGRWAPWQRDRETPTVTALRDVSLRVDRGESVGVAGPSGSGKSTLLHVLAGLLLPGTGMVRVAGTDLTTLSTPARTRFRHRHVGLVFQSFHLLPTLSARANVALPLVQSGVRRGQRRERATALLDRLGLGDRVHHRPGELSGGERQRVAIARALVTDPDVLLADEPTGELDSGTGNRVVEALTDLAGDRALVLASHDESALAATDRTVRLVDGGLADGSH